MSPKLFVFFLIAVFFLASTVSGEEKSKALIPVIISHYVKQTSKTEGKQDRDLDEMASVVRSVRPLTYISPKPQPTASKAAKKYVSENIAADVFTLVLKEKGAVDSGFRRNYRPKWLKNPETGRNLEIDVYYEPWKIGMEYNGAQHYVFPNLFHPDTQEGRREFDNQLKRDRTKRVLANIHGVKIIDVPYYVDNCEDGDNERRIVRVSPKTKAKRIAEHIRKSIDRIQLPY